MRLPLVDIVAELGQAVPFHVLHLLCRSSWIYPLLHYVAAMLSLDGPTAGPACSCCSGKNCFSWNSNWFQVAWASLCKRAPLSPFVICQIWFVPAEADMKSNEVQWGWYVGWRVVGRYEVSQTSLQHEAIETWKPWRYRFTKSCWSTSSFLAFLLSSKWCLLKRALPLIQDRARALVLFRTSDGSMWKFKFI